MSLKKDNKGSTIVLVIVVFAIVGVLSTVALWIALNNYQMKITNKKVSDSFYSAEGVLDQICAGLQSEESIALNAAYTEIMQKYNTYADAETRNTAFAAIYQTRLKERLKNGTYATQCSTTKLASYVSAATTGSGYLYIHSADKNATGAYIDDYVTMGVDLSAGGLVLKNLMIEYTDASGYLSIIQTDLVLTSPEMNLTESGVAPAIFGFSLIGNKGINVDTNGTVIKGNVFAGSVYSASQFNAGYTVGESDYDGLVVGNAGTVDLSDAGYVIVDGDVVNNNTTTNSASFTTGENTNLWSRNITVNGSTVALDGATFLSDDMTLKGASPRATVEGNYVGYGNGTASARGSSAIILNGTESYLDISGADSVEVAGYAYISTSKINSKKGTTLNTTDIENTNDVATGESILVKGDQIAYLMPAECIGTGINDTASNFHQNPLSIADYNTIINNSSTYKLVNKDSVITKTGKKLEAYLNGRTEDNCYTTIFVPSKTGNAADGLVYIYLNIDNQSAAAYFKEYYAADSSRIEKYTDFYSSGIKAATGDTATIYTAGTYATYTETTDEAGNRTRTLAHNDGKTLLYGNIENFQYTYKALTTRLLSDYSELTTAQKSQILFKNLVKYTELTNYLAGVGSSFESTITTSEGNATVVLRNGDYVYDKVTTTPHLIIATGDVTVKRNFSGTIIAGGTITVGTTDNITIQTVDTGIIKQLLSVQCGTNSVSDFLVDGTASVSTGMTGAASAATSEIVLAELIKYQNWKKM